MEKHAVDKISVIVDMREFEIVWSGLTDVYSADCVNN